MRISESQLSRTDDTDITTSQQQDSQTYLLGFAYSTQPTDYFHKETNLELATRSSYIRDKNKLHW